MAKKSIRTFQSEFIFQRAGIKDTEDARKVLKYMALVFAYLSKGDTLQIGEIVFKKLAEDLIHIDTQLDLTAQLDSLKKKKIIRFPL